MNSLSELEKNEIIKNNFLVICGHQVNLLGGPLFVLYKWISTLVRAKQLGGSSLFYMEGNDSDFSEINRIWLMDQQNRHQNFVWNFPGRNVSCGLLVVDRNLRNLLRAMLDQLPRTVHTDFVRTIVLESYQEGIRLPEATSRYVQYLFPHQKLSCFDATCSKYLQSIRFILEKELLNTDIGGRANVWARKDDVRIALFRKDQSTWVDRNQREVDCESMELLPNFLTRSICQDFYFRTKEYIQGESEVEYMKNTDSWYETHQVAIPKRTLRMNPLLITRETQRTLEQLGISPQEVEQNHLEDFLKHQFFKKTGVHFGNHWHKMEHIKNDTVNSLINLGISLKDITHWEKKCYKSFRLLFAAWRKQQKIQYKEWIQAIQNASRELRPRGIPQGEGGHMIAFLNRYGLQGIQTIQDACCRGEETIILD